MGKPNRRRSRLLVFKAFDSRHVQVSICSLWLALVLALGFQTVVPILSGTDDTTVWIDPSSKQVAVGELFNVTIQVNNLPNVPSPDGAVGFEIRLIWDPTVLKGVKATEVLYHSVTPEANWDNIWKLADKIGNGSYYYAYTFMSIADADSAGYSPIVGDHTIIIITLNGTRNGSSALTFESVKIADEINPYPMPCVTINSTVTVGSPPPEFSISSPVENGLYNSSPVDLTFVSSKTTSWTGYSMDGNPNVTIVGNAAKIAASDGEHSLIVYGNDTQDQMGVSAPLHFTVDTLPPTATFTYSPKPPEPEYNLGSFKWTLHFDAAASSDATSGITAYDWNFGDGATAAGISANHVYNSPGSYTTKLTVRDNAGNSATTTQTVTISPPPPIPVFAISLPVEGGIYNLSSIDLVFTSSQTTSWVGYGVDGKANVTLVGNHAKIDLSDGQHALIVYGNDTLGQVGSSALIHFTTDTLPPTVSFTYSPQPPQPEDNNGNIIWPLSFNANASIDATSGIAAYGWDFGDGTTANGVSPDHTYNSPGSYGVKLTIKDHAGNSATKTKTVTIIPPSAGPEFDVSSPVEGGIYNSSSVDLAFTANQITSWAGYSVDGNANVTVLGNSAKIEVSDGEHTLIVYGNDTLGQMGASGVIHFITDMLPPVTSYTYSPQPPEPVNVDGNVTWPVSFDAAASSDATSGIALYDWDFGDGSKGTGVSVNHMYNNPGSYSVKLTVTDYAGNSATETKIVKINPPFVIPDFPFLGTIGSLAVMLFALLVFIKRKK